MLDQDRAHSLDEMLLDVVTAIEPTDNDRQVAERRYGLLEQHLLRPASPLRQYLLGSALIYPQGSKAIGATIVSGTDDDRFDVDAMVEFPVPQEWLPSDVLDQLFDALQGFPGVRNIERCTRCVQLQFAFMHMDVTVADPANEPREPRVGEIFHSPTSGAAYRIPANPFGFAGWFRANAQMPTAEFEKALLDRRARAGRDRLVLSDEELREVYKADQEGLPQVVPPRLDSVQVLALKLLKRYLNLRYEERDRKRPPSVYLSKLAILCGHAPEGLSAQLERLCGLIAHQMERAVSPGKWEDVRPDERNPKCEADRFNDRWPVDTHDCQLLLNDMMYLMRALRAARKSEFKDIVRVLSELFGERVGSRAAKLFADRAAEGGRVRYEKGTGQIVSGLVSTPAVARNVAAAPEHRFHSAILKRSNGGPKGR